MCALCGPQTKYCSSECQTQDWPDHQHVCGNGQSIEEEEGLIDGMNFRPNSISTSGANTLLRRRSTRHSTRSPMTNASSDPSRDPMGPGAGQTSTGPASPDNDLLVGSSQGDTRTEEEKVEELRFYVQQIYLIVKPVLACIVLSIFWVKVANSGSSSYA